MRLTHLDHAHVWHPFTPMKQWRENEPLIIERAEGDYIIDIEGSRYIDGVSSLWCNVHGHRVPAIDAAIREQLDNVAHTTLLGLASPPSIELAAKLVALAPGNVDNAQPHAAGQPRPLNKVFYSDAGATALEVAFKMAVGYWYHRGGKYRQKNQFIGLAGAYHGDTIGSMSVGYSDLFHKPFLSMVFRTHWFASPDVCRMQDFAWSHVAPGRWPSEDEAPGARAKERSLNSLKQLLEAHAHETAAICIEPIMQGAAGMVCQPHGFVREVAALARKYEVLLIADEVATGFGRTGVMFACDREGVTPDILCLAKGLTGGYLPLAATLATDEIEQAFCGELDERKTLYHGHTYTGNPLACAAALASLDLFEQNDLLSHIRQSEAIIRERLNPLRQCPHVLDVRQRGVMAGIELCRDRRSAEPFDFAAQVGARLCLSLRQRGVIVRPLGNVIILMPIPAMKHDTLTTLVDEVVKGVLGWDFG